MRVLFVKIKKLFIILFEWEISINDNFIYFFIKGANNSGGHCRD